MDEPDDQRPMGIQRVAKSFTVTSEIVDDNTPFFKQIKRHIEGEMAKHLDQANLATGLIAKDVQKLHDQEFLGSIKEQIDANLKTS